jgi:hypothetical protein
MQTGGGSGFRLIGDRVLEMNKTLSLLIGERALLLERVY